MFVLRGRRRPLAALAVLLAAACGGDMPTGPGPGAADLNVVGGVNVERTSGSGQAAPVNTTLKRPLMVRVVDLEGRPLVGAFLEWRVLSGGGSLGNVQFTTDENGYASARWTLGPAEGRQVAEVVGPNGARARYAADAFTGHFGKVSGDGQSGPPGQRLGQPLVVQVTRADGTPIPGVIVTWTATEGGGSVRANTAKTGSDGRVTAYWTLGTYPGTNTVVVETEGMPALTFTATGINPTRVSFIQMNPGDTSFEVGDTSYVYATALDDASLPVLDAVLTWSVDRGGIIQVYRIEPQGRSYAYVYFRGVSPGEVRLTASAGGKSNTILIRVYAEGTEPIGGGGGGSANVIPVGPGSF